MTVQLRLSDPAPDGYRASHSFAPPVVPWPELLQEAAERVARAERDLNDLRACAERVGAQVGS